MTSTIDEIFKRAKSGPQLANESVHDNAHLDVPHMHHIESKSTAKKGKDGKYGIEHEYAPHDNHSYGNGAHLHNFVHKYRSDSPHGNAGNSDHTYHVHTFDDNTGTTKSKKFADHHEAVGHWKKIHEKTLDKD